MKKTGFITVCWLLLSAMGMVSAQNQEAVFQKVSSAISAKDAVALTGVFHATVEMTLPGITDGAYAQKQAQLIIRDFFNNYPPTSFKIQHKGNSGNTFYATGVYVSAKGTFDTNIFVRNMGGNFVVTQIRFEAE